MHDTEERIVSACQKVYRPHLSTIMQAVNGSGNGFIYQHRCTSQWEPSTSFVRVFRPGFRPCSNISTATAAENGNAFGIEELKLKMSPAGN